MKSPKIQIIKRDSYSFPVFFTDADCNKLDITGYTLFFTVKALADLDKDDTSAKIQKIITEHTDPEEGESLITLESDDTDISAGTYWYDIQLKCSNGGITSCVSGEFIIIQDVTKSVDIPSV
jgi:hypothetical protein